MGECLLVNRKNDRDLRPLSLMADSCENSNLMHFFEKTETTTTKKLEENSLSPPEKTELISENSF